MSFTTSREIRLASRPHGLPTPADFRMARREIPPPAAGEVLVRNLFMSVDPYMRGRMNAGRSYVPAYEPGEPLDGGAVGVVEESRATGFQKGDTVLSNLGWREYFVASPGALRPIDPKVEPLSLYLGTLGMPGMTAWVALKLAEVKTTDVVFVSGAAGAVGNVAGQLAKIRGCRVIGSAGSREKVAFLREECRFDDAFDYKDGPRYDQLARLAPDGIDVYLDNVGGEALEAALSSMRLSGRIIAIGGISSYNDETLRPGPKNLFNLVAKRLTMKGMIVRDWADHQDEFEREVGGLFRSGKLKNKETVAEGIESAVEAFLGLFQGRNVGKMVVRLG
jgi:NADPH-dependent curcumin reductase CurA